MLYFKNKVGSFLSFDMVLSSCSSTRLSDLYRDLLEFPCEVILVFMEELFYYFLYFLNSDWSI